MVKTPSYPSSRRFVFQFSKAATSSRKQALARLQTLILTSDPKSKVPDDVKRFMAPLFKGKSRPLNDLYAKSLGYGAWSDVGASWDAGAPTESPSRMDEDLTLNEFLEWRELQFGWLRNAIDQTVCDESLRTLLEEWQPTARYSGRSVSHLARHKNTRDVKELEEFFVASYQLLDQLVLRLKHGLHIQLTDAALQLLHDTLERLSGVEAPDLITVVRKTAFCMLWQPSATPVTQSQGIALLEKLASQRDVEASIQLGHILFSGEFGVDKDLKRAHDLSLKGTTPGVKLSNESIFLAYRVAGTSRILGSKPYQSVGRAIDILEIGANAGDPICSLKIAVLLYKGEIFGASAVPTKDIDFARAIMHCANAIEQLQSVGSGQPQSDASTMGFLQRLLAELTAEKAAVDDLQRAGS